jgi:HK97 family phage major capsid protein
MKLAKFKELIATLQKADESDPIKKAMALVDGTPITDADGNEIDVETIELTLAAGEEAPAEEAPAEEGQASVSDDAIQRAVDAAIGRVKAFNIPRAGDVKTDTLPKSAQSYRVKNFKGNGSADAQFKAHGFGTWLQWLHLDGKSRNSQRGKWLVQNGIMSKASFEGANSSGGALVPEEFMADLIRLVEEYGVARANCQVVPMTREVMPWPRRTGGLTGTWMTEAKSDSATAITKSDPTFANVQLVAKKLATLSLVSSELMEDSAIALGDFFAQEIAQTFAEEEDDACFNGDGTNTYGGIVGVLNHAGTASVVTAATGNTAFSTLDLADFHEATGALPRYAQSGAKWYISQQGFANSMERLAHAQGGVTRMETEQGSQLSFLGYPVEITQKLNSTTTAQTSTNIIAFGNLAQGVLFGDRRSADIKMSEDRYFDTDQIAVRGIERLDIQCHDFDSTSVAGPMIVMATPSS